MKIIKITLLSAFLISNLHPSFFSTEYIKDMLGKMLFKNEDNISACAEEDPFQKLNIICDNILTHFDEKTEVYKDEFKRCDSKVILLLEEKDDTTILRAGYNENSNEVIFNSIKLQQPPIANDMLSRSQVGSLTETVFTKYFNCKNCKNFNKELLVELHKQANTLQIEPFYSFEFNKKHTWKKARLLLCDFEKRLVEATKRLFKFYPKDRRYYCLPEILKDLNDYIKGKS